MKKLLFLLLCYHALNVSAQQRVQLNETRRQATKQDVKVLAHLADSLLSELKVLYKVEQKENKPNKYQPERIALIRSYLLLFQHMETSCSIISYSTKDVTQIFGKSDTLYHVTLLPNHDNGMEWIYGNVQKKYVRINNLRYRFFFKNGRLEAVKRDDK